jgi:ABC transporter DrrB family efflux protein
VTAVRWAAHDTLVMTRRNLFHYLRLPALVAIAIAQPVLFVVMFTYVFQGAIATPPGIDYVDYLMPGIFVLAVAFGSINTGVGLADDLSTGMVDRFRSLPMARSALLGGRTLADAVRNLLVVLLMVAAGALIGFRFHAGPLAATGAIALTVALGYLLSWFSALIGLTTGDAETAGTASLLPIIPLSFTSSHLRPHRHHARLARSLGPQQPHHPHRRRQPRPHHRRPHHPTRPPSHRLAPRAERPGHPPGRAQLQARHQLTLTVDHCPYPPVERPCSQSCTGVVAARSNRHGANAG